MDTHAQAPELLFALAVTLVCAVTDLRTGRIYNRVTVPAIVLGLAWHAASGDGGRILAGVAGFLAGIVPFGFAATRGWIGGGDAKLFAAIGAVLGPTLLLDVALVTFLAAALWGAAALARREGPAGAARRFLGGMRMVLRGAEADDTTSGPSLRLGAFVFFGTLATALAIFLTP